MEFDNVVCKMSAVCLDLHELMYFKLYQSADAGCKYTFNDIRMMTSSNGNIFRVTGPLCGALMFSLTRAWMNDWVNDREAGDLRSHLAHYDVILMRLSETKPMNPCICPTSTISSLDNPLLILPSECEQTIRLPKRMFKEK